MALVSEVGDNIEYVSQGGEEEEKEVNTATLDSKRIELQVGMSFKSIEEDEACYTDYGQSRGFSIKKKSTYKTLSRSEDVTGMVFSCKKDANRVKATAPHGLLMHDSHVGFQAARVSDLCLRGTQLAYMASGSDSGYKIVSKYLDKAYEDVNACLLQERENNALNSISGGSCASSRCEGNRVENLLLDPHISQTKDRKRNAQGREKEPRIKSGLELATEKNKVKPRICKACGGNGHDSRNCKKKNEN